MHNRYFGVARNIYGFDWRKILQSQNLLHKPKCDWAMAFLTILGTLTNK